MIYGYKDPFTGAFRKFTRVSSTAAISGHEAMSVADLVWVGHYSCLDGSGGLEIHEGAQIGNWCGIYSHSSEDAIRLLGAEYVNVDRERRHGYKRGPVVVGSYAFIGAGSVILPGVTVGKGAIVAPLSLVGKDVPDQAIVMGVPARVVGNTRDRDASYFTGGTPIDTYYDAQVANDIQRRLSNTVAGSSSGDVSFPEGM